MKSTENKTTAVDNATRLENCNNEVDQKAKKLCDYIEGLQLPQSTAEELIGLIADHVADKEARALMKGFLAGTDYTTQTIKAFTMRLHQALGI